MANAQHQGGPDLISMAWKDQNSKLHVCFLLNASLLLHRNAGKAGHPGSGIVCIRFQSISGHEVELPLGGHVGDSFYFLHLSTFSKLPWLRFLFYYGCISLVYARSSGTFLTPHLECLSHFFMAFLPIASPAKEMPNNSY